MKKEKVLGVIPARYNSSRFPAKLLHTIAGKSLIQHTYENTKQFAILDDLVIATDDLRILNHVTAFGAKAVLTSDTCPTGTDRIAEVVSRYPQYGDATIIVNVQGDEPCLPHDLVNKVVAQLLADSTASMATAACPIVSKQVALDHSVPKCVMDRQGNALYFSRTLIPSSHKAEYCPNTCYHQHIGVYAFRTEFLLEFPLLPASALQAREDLEMLKVLENGYRIKIAVVPQQEIPGVNTPEDIAKVESILCQQNICSSREASAHLSVRG